MNKLASFLCFCTALFLLGACTSNTEDEGIGNDDAASAVSASEKDTEENAKPSDKESESSDTSKNTSEKEAGNHEDSDASEESNQNIGKGKEENPLSQYSTEQIEFARVWLMLGENQQVDELNAVRIPAGTPINPNDETSEAYPEDVVQLSGSRLVDGSVTYSGNGDGTINVYEVPLRWEASVPDDLDEDFMRIFTKDIIDNTSTFYVNPGEAEHLVPLMEVMHLHN